MRVSGPVGPAGLVWSVPGRPGQVRANGNLTHVRSGFMPLSLGRRSGVSLPVPSISGGRA